MLTYCLVPFCSYHRLVFKFWSKNDHVVFLTLFGGLWATYKCHVHLRLIGKLVVDCLFVLIELLTLGVTTEVLRTYIDRKSEFSNGGGSVLAKFSHSEGHPP